MGVMEGTGHFEDSMTTQRLYWYRKQRLTHNTAPCGYMPHQMPNITETYRPSALNNALDTVNTEYPTASNAMGGINDNGRLSSCRFDRAERFSLSGTPANGKEAKKTSPKKDLSNLPPLDISEVIDTLTTLSSEGKLGKGNASPKESSDADAEDDGDVDADDSVKVKGELCFPFLFQSVEEEVKRSDSITNM